MKYLFVFAFIALSIGMYSFMEQKPVEKSKEVVNHFYKLAVNGDRFDTDDYISITENEYNSTTGCVGSGEVCRLKLSAPMPANENLVDTDSDNLPDELEDSTPIDEIKEKSE